MQSLVSQGLLRPAIGLASDRLGRINVAGIGTLLAGLSAFFLWIFAASHFPGLIIYALFGGFSGVIWPCVAPVGAEVVGLQLLPSGTDTSHPPSKTWQDRVLTLHLSLIDLLARLGVTGHLVRHHPSSSPAPVPDANSKPQCRSDCSQSSNLWTQSISPCPRFHGDDVYRFVLVQYGFLFPCSRCPVSNHNASMAFEKLETAAAGIVGARREGRDSTASTLKRSRASHGRSTTPRRIACLSGQYGGDQESLDFITAFIHHTRGR